MGVTILTPFQIAQLAFTFMETTAKVSLTRCFESQSNISHGANALLYRIIYGFLKASRTSCIYIYLDVFVDIE